LSLLSTRGVRMRVVRFCMKNCSQARLGVQLGGAGNDGEIVDLIELANINDTIDLIKSGPDGFAKIKKIVEDGHFRIPFVDVQLLAPISGPDKVICIGMNYVDHCEEQNLPVPTEPVIFNKFPSSIVGPNDDIPYPDVTEELDWEVELAVIIGKSCKNVSEADAMDHVYGYTVAHDVSARDWQLKKNGGQWLAGKTMDAFCPLGPAIVTKDELGDPHNLNLKCLVNGEVKQDSNTNQLVFKTEQLVSWCSKLFTLLPGDVILTGTPPGVGIFRQPPQFLKRGDVVECVIDKIGTVTNKVV